MRHGTWMLAAALLAAPACKGSITGSTGGGATPAGAAGAMGGGGTAGAMLAPPGTTPMPVDPMNTDAAKG